MPVSLKSRIPLIIADLDPETLAGIAEGAEEVVEDAKERVPVASGKLRDAIHVDVEEAEKRVSIIAGDDDAFYGHIVERGSVNTPPHPFLVPAFEANRAAIEKIVGEKLDDL